MTTTLPKTATRPYYDVLDGLRGSAAIVVLLFHYLEMIYPDYAHSPLGHGFLAVDFFFCLSGFVVAFAYDGRVEKIGTRNFFINRLIRLHPMVVLGTLVGVIGAICNPFINDFPLENWKLISLAILGSLFLIPTPFLPNKGGALFPYNSPSWSLFFEYIINIVYALVLSRLRRGWVLVLGILAAIWLVYTASSSGWIINGWSIDGMSDGFPRVAYSFTAGLLIFRYKAILNNRFGFLLPLILLIAVFAFPHHENDWITESVLVVVIFPIILSIGAGATVKGWVQKFCVFLGKLSYPLYMTHIATVWIFGNYYYGKPETRATGADLVLLVAALMAFNIVVAYLAMRFYDEPLRKYLTKKWKERQAK